VNDLLNGAVMPSFWLHRPISKRSVKEKSTQDAQHPAPHDECIIMAFDGSRLQKPGSVRNRPSASRYGRLRLPSMDNAETKHYQNHAGYCS